MTLDYNSPVIVIFLLAGTVVIGASVRSLLRDPWLNIPAGLYALFLTLWSDQTIKAPGGTLLSYGLGIGFAALAFWRSWQVIRNRR